MISLLVDAKKCIVKNKAEPKFDRLPEADISDMEAFLEELQLILPVIGVDIFRRPSFEKERSENGKDSETKFTLQHASKGISATAIGLDGEFVIFAGSTGNLNVSPSFPDRVNNIREQTLESGRVERLENNRFRLVEDIAFSSPSAGAVFLFGTSRNGRTDWIVEGQDIHYGSWKEKLVSENN